MDGKKHIITVVALGPDSGDMLTCGAYDALKGADRLLLRTGRHGVADRLAREGAAFETLDALYERTEDFDELCELAVRAIIKRAEEAQTLCYAVSEPQSDATVRALAKALPGNAELRIIGGVTLTDAAACAVIPFGVNTENLRTVTALSLTTRRRFTSWKTPPSRAQLPGRLRSANWTGRRIMTTEPPCSCRKSAYTTEAARPTRTLYRSSAVCARPAGARGTGRRPITH